MFLLCSFLFVHGETKQRAGIVRLYCSPAPANSPNRNLPAGISMGPVLSGASSQRRPSVCWTHYGRAAQTAIAAPRCRAQDPRSGPRETAPRRPGHGNNSHSLSPSPPRGETTLHGRCAAKETTPAVGPWTRRRGTPVRAPPLPRPPQKSPELAPGMSSGERCGWWGGPARRRGWWQKTTPPRHQTPQQRRRRREEEAMRKAKVRTNSFLPSTPLLPRCCCCFQSSRASMAASLSPSVPVMEEEGSWRKRATTRRSPTLPPGSPFVLLLAPPCLFWPNRAGATCRGLSHVHDRRRHRPPLPPPPLPLPLPLPPTTTTYPPPRPLLSSLTRRCLYRRHRGSRTAVALVGEGRAVEALGMLSTARTSTHAAPGSAVAPAPHPRSKQVPPPNDEDEEDEEDEEEGHAFLRTPRDGPWALRDRHGASQRPMTSRRAGVGDQRWHFFQAPWSSWSLLPLLLGHRLCCGWLWPPQLQSLASAASRAAVHEGCG